MIYANTEPAIWYVTAAHNPDWLLAELRAGQARLLWELCDERGKNTPNLRRELSILEGVAEAHEQARQRIASALRWLDCVLDPDDSLDHAIDILSGKRQP